MMNKDSERNLPKGDILVVEDEPSNLKFWDDYLTQCGYRVRPAIDGELALRSVQAKLPDLIVLDFNLPGMNGIEVCRHLKADPESRAIPVIFLSGLETTDLKVQALEAGAIDYVTKPVDPTEFLVRIENHLKLFRLQRELALQSKELRKEIEERKLAEKKIARFSMLLEHSLNEIFIFDSETFRFIDANLGALMNLGYSMEELKEMTPVDFKPEFTEESFTKLVAPLRSGAEQKIVFTTIHRRKDKTLYPVEVHLQLMPEEPPVFVAIILDISERQKMEQRYRELVEGTTDLITQVDSEGNLLYSNHMGKKIFGYDSKQLVGKDAFQFIHPDDRSKTTTWFNDCLNKHLLQGSIENRQVNQETGTVHDLLWTTNFHYDEQGKFICINGIARDITEQKKLEEQLFQNEKLATIAGLAAGVAHEINTPLSAILQAHQLLEMGLSPEETDSKEKAAECNVDLTAVQDYFKKNELDYFMAGIRESALKAGNIIKNLLEFSRPHEGSFSTINLEEIMESSLLLSQSDYDMKKKYDIMNVRIVKEYEPDPASIICVATEIEQVILNLIKNSVQAMTGADLPEKPCIVLRTAITDNCAVIEVEDNGPGIPEDIKNNIFDPFFTTKDVGSGTGLGLSVSHAIIVDKHKGKIRVESVPGQGAKFVIELPLTQA